MPRPLPPTRRRALALVCGLALTSLLLACDPEPDAGGGALPPAVVGLLRVEPEPIQLTAAIPGQLTAEKSVEVRSEIDGVVAEVLFQEGERAEEGEILIRLRDHEQRAVLQEAQAALSLAQAVHKRTQVLADRDVSSAAQLDNARAELDVARARLARARVELDRTTIRAPYDGVLGVKRVDEGDHVSTDIPLVRIDAVDRLQLLFSVVETYSARVRPGIQVTIQVAPYPEEVFPGEVFFVAPALDPSLRRLPCKAWIPNPDHRLRPGLFAEIQAEIAESYDAILIPESALLYGLEGPFVWKVDSDYRPFQALVEVGEHQDGRVEITVGLSSGDVVVSSGVHKVMEGAPLAPAEPMTTAAPEISETNGS